MARTQKYPTEFRREAVDLVKGGMRQSDVCRLLGV
jgi:transposase-like protein